MKKVQVLLCIVAVVHVKLPGVCERKTKTAR